MGTHVARGRVVEWVAFCLVTGALLFLWLWRGEVMEVETEFGEPRLRVAVVAAAVLAGSASAGYATRSWAAVLAVTIAPFRSWGRGRWS